MPVDLRDRLAGIRRRIAGAAARGGRAPGQVRLIAVTKTFGAGHVEAAIAAGLADIGENRVQEARNKKPYVAGRATWHLIGHLQSNKAREAARLFDVVQTVDSPSLAEKLARAAREEGKTLGVLLQVNVGGEEQKSGIDPGDVEGLAAAVAALPGLTLSGLMTVPPLAPPETVRPLFRELRLLRDRLCEIHPACLELSMGMSDDFEVAVEEGSTMVRLGRALFGERP